MLGLFRGWHRRRAERAPLVEADALALMARHGDAAYDVARDRVRDQRDGRTIDLDRPRGRWTRVKLRVAVSGRRTSTDTATRMAERGDA